MSAVSLWRANFLIMKTADLLVTTLILILTAAQFCGVMNEWRWQLLLLQHVWIARVIYRVWYGRRIMVVIPELISITSHGCIVVKHVHFANCWSLIINYDMSIFILCKQTTAGSSLIFLNMSQFIKYMLSFTYILKKIIILIVHMYFKIPCLGICLSVKAQRMDERLSSSRDS